jgi:hypothetical protein
VATKDSVCRVVNTIGPGFVVQPTSSMSKKIWIPSKRALTVGTSRPAASSATIASSTALSTIGYRLSRGPLRGLWLRGRFAWGHFDNARRDSLEGRVVLRYEFQSL